MHGAGLVMNCVVAGLYMASYMLMIPTAAEVRSAYFLHDIFLISVRSLRC